MKKEHLKRILIENNLTDSETNILILKKGLESGDIELNVNEYFEDILMSEDIPKLKYLISGLKTTTDNLFILHHHIICDNFFSDHEKIGEYYEKLIEIQDDVIEILISLGEKDISIYDASRICPSLKVQDFLPEEAFCIISKMFEMLIQGFESTKDLIPSDVYSKFEEYIYWLRKERNYKLKQYFKMK